MLKSEMIQITVGEYIMLYRQGRIQDLSEGGGARFISKKNPDLGTKRRAGGENFFR